MSRYLAKSLIESFKDNENVYVCIFWDKSLTHYYVGLTCNEYSLTLDLDNLDNIKDLTRIKTGLTAEGIVILEDSTGKFKTALDKFNTGRTSDAMKKIEESQPQPNFQNVNNSPEIKELSDIIFLSNAIQILKNGDTPIDSQGLFEYLKEIVDIKFGPETRKKIWKEIAGTHSENNRYIRCLVVTLNQHQYLIDVDEECIRKFSDTELSEDGSTPFSSYKSIAPRSGRDLYDGS